MLSRLMKLLSTQPAPGDAAGAAHRRQLAAAALLVAVARSDHALDPREEARMELALRRRFALTPEDVEDLMELAHARSRESTSDYDFTRVVNDGFTDAEKSALLAEMWGVAFADGHLHRYEEHLIRRIAELIYLPHSEFIRTRLRAAQEAGAAPDASG